MTDLLAMTEALVQGEVRCVVCGVNPVVMNPETGVLVILDALVVEDEHGRFVARCKGCRD